MDAAVHVQGEAREPRFDGGERFRRQRLAERPHEGLRLVRVLPERAVQPDAEMADAGPPDRLVQIHRADRVAGRVSQVDVSEVDGESLQTRAGVQQTQEVERVSDVAVRHHVQPLDAVQADDVRTRYVRRAPQEAHVGLDSDREVRGRQREPRADVPPRRRP